jgi:hypothetical protein
VFCHWLGCERALAEASALASSPALIFDFDT